MNSEQLFLDINSKLLIDQTKPFCSSGGVAKSRTAFKCKECGYESPKWLGRCPECSSWDSFVEVTRSEEGLNQSKNIESKDALGVASLGELIEKSQTQKERRIYPFASEDLNKFWGGGITVGGLTLLAGEPGLGKSTLALQLLRSLQGKPKVLPASKTGTPLDRGELKTGKFVDDQASKDSLSPFQGGVGGGVVGDTQSLKLLYITAEESVMELARRSQRLQIPKEILVMQTNNMDQIERTLTKEKPNVVIIDSIQTIFSSEINGSPGSVSQVSSLASQFLAISKSQNISIILIGHVTKEGQIAGPKTLEHLVDSVVLLESTKSAGYRTLSFSKHRFGSTEGLLLLKMEESGLQIVTDPSLALLENLESGTGVVYGMAMDKDLPLVVEVQALVSDSHKSEGGYGRREAIGLTTAKLNTILAIGEKYLGLDLKSNDVYVQLTGLPKSVVDQSLDLPILLAVLSSVRGGHLPSSPLVRGSRGASASARKILDREKQGVNQFSSEKENKKPIYAGRLTLSGKIRKATNEEARQKTAKKLGFEFNPGVELGDMSGLVR